MNNVNLIGRLTKDIELRRSATGTAIVTNNLAVQRDKDTTDFIPLVFLSKQAEILTLHVNKGSRIGIEGKLQTRSYEDKMGQKRFVMEVLVFRVEFLDKKKETEDFEKTFKVVDPFANRREIEENISDDDLPF